MGWYKYKSIANYHRLYFSDTCKFKFSKDNTLRAKVGLSIRNVYNNTDFISRGYRGINDINGDIETIDRFLIEFTPNLMFRLYWW
ncbi:MAG: hypothetical protein ACJARX_001780 [Psychroserpens sp.]|jgi:hypothetical protein|uniref:hypothetical protein n=1 Tax=Psychroserpens sp. TaxID=2020870 RepID=UPI0039E7124C